MATGNFYQGNADKIYAVLMSYEIPILDDDGNETEDMETVAPESWEIDDFKENFIEAAKEAVKDTQFNFSPNYGLEDNNRDFNAHGLGSLYASKTYAGYSVGVTIKMGMRSAYYEGANLDWEVEVNYEGYNVDNVDNLEQEFIYRAEPNAGMAALLAKHASKWALTAEEELLEIVKKLYEDQSTPLVVTARFSNGETWYAKETPKTILKEIAIS